MPVLEADDLGLKETDEERRARIESNPLLPDALRELYLDETLMTTREISEEFGVSQATVGNWSIPAVTERKPRPHPRMLPTSDGTVGSVAGRPHYGRERGRVYEWALQKGWWYYDPAKGRPVLLGSTHRGGPRKKAARRA